MTCPAAFLSGVHRRFGDPATIRTYWTAEPMVLFSHPATIRELFALPAEIAPAGRSWRFLEPFAGRHSILLLDGEPHLRERRLLQRPFHGDHVARLAPVVADLARRELDTWNGRVVTLERMRALTLRVITRTIFGAGTGTPGPEPIIEAVERTLGRVRSLPRMLAMALVQREFGRWSPWARFRRDVERFDSLLYELIVRLRAAAGQGEADSVLALLLAQRDEAGNPPEDRHLRDQLVALLVGGHDSSAASLAWAFERLARHPDVQDRLRNENTDAYLNAVVKEVLRVRPALTIAPRLLLEPARVGGVELPAGVQVAACLWLAMRRRDLWPDADAFRPERWLDSGAPAGPWIPFGGGVRRCAGSPFAEMELREVLRAAAPLQLGTTRRAPERSRRSMLVVVPSRGGEVLVSRSSAYRPAR
jgi:cytochrome P450